MGRIGAAGVLRLRATSAVSRDKSVRRSAQDDDFVASWRRSGRRFCGGLEMQKTSVFSGFYFLPNKLALMGLRPIVFGPGTLPRQAPRLGRGRLARGTRPVPSDLAMTPIFVALDWAAPQVVARATSSPRSATVVDSVPRGMEGAITRAWLWPSNQTRNADLSAPGRRCWFSQL